jgi:hypothetical protein
MHSEIEIELSDPIPDTGADIEKTGKTVRINGLLGTDQCVGYADNSEMSFSNLNAVADVIQISVYAKASNPCAFLASAIAPSIQYFGTFKIDVAAHTVSFDGMISQFPAFEIYASADDGRVKSIFLSLPSPGADPWNLYLGPTQPVHGFTAF